MIDLTGVCSLHVYKQISYMLLACGIFNALISEVYVPARTKSYTMAAVSVASKYADRHTTFKYALILITLCKNHHMNYTVKKKPLLYT
jgi:hypothetical protein